MKLSLKKLWTTVRKSLQGEHGDFTKGPIADAVILLAIPMILELSLEGVFAVVDMFFVSKLGQNSIATVGLTESVLTIVYSIAIGFSTGAAAVVARRVGEKNFEGAAHAGAQSIVFSILVSILISIAGAYFAPDILRLMGASPEVVSEGAIFTRILMGGSTAIVLLFLINGVFRGAGDAAMAMKSLWVASGTNIILCPILIYFYGLKGAAIATLVGRSSGVIYQSYHLFKGKGLLKFKKKHFALDFPVIKTIVNIAWPATLQFVIGSGSWIILTKFVADAGGTAASAGYQIAFRNFVFFILPAWGLSNAAATLMGQNMGAREYDRAEESVYTTAKYSAVVMLFVTIFFLLFTEPLVKIFTHDETVMSYGIQALRILGLGYIAYGIGMVMTQALNGAGDSRTPTWLNFICFWIFQIPFAWYLAQTMGAHGVIISIPLSNALLALLAWLYFRKGKWKSVKV